jgi:hypothetical protein
MEPLPLCDRYPRLFSISVQKEVMINEVWEGVSRWDLWWRRRLFVWEEELLGELREALPLLELSQEEDAWFWARAEFSLFTRHTFSLVLYMNQFLMIMNCVFSTIYGKVWHHLRLLRSLGNSSGIEFRRGLTLLSVGFKQWVM